MAAKQKTIFVYDDFSSEQPVLMGILYVNVIKGGESYSFEYDREWLKKTGLRITLDPELIQCMLRIKYQRHILFRESTITSSGDCTLFVVLKDYLITMLPPFNDIGSELVFNRQT